MAALALALTLLMIAAPAERASAGRSWCKADPILIIDGQLADLWVSSEVRMLLSATGPIQVQVTAPTGTAHSVLLADLGFGRGYDISWVESDALVKTDEHTPVQISVLAPASRSLPVTVEFRPRLLNLFALLTPVSASGSSNAWVSLSS